jgi:hypothetical protein
MTLSVASSGGVIGTFLLIVSYNGTFLIISDGPEGRGLIPRGGKIFLLSVTSKPALGPTHPPIQWVSGALSQGVKRQGRQSDHSPPSIARVKNGGALPPISHTSS